MTPVQIAFGLFFFFLHLPIFLWTIFSLQIQGRAWYATSLEDKTWKTVARLLGYITTYYIAVLFFLATRKNVVLKPFGVPLTISIDFHKTIAWFFVVACLGHALLYFYVWYQEDHLDALLRRENLFALAAAGCSIPIILSSIPYCRRSFYWLFSMMHYLAYPFLIFACLHNWDIQIKKGDYRCMLLFYFVIPGLILYGFDHYLRWASYKRYPTETVLVEPKEGHCRILLKQTRTESDIKNIKNGEFLNFFVHCSEVTPRWATWHPFSVACIDVLNPTIDAECDGIEIFDKEEDETEKLAKLEIQYTFLIKATGNGNWTDNLSTLATQSSNLSFNLEGPYIHRSSLNLDEMDGYCFLCGGVGITSSSHTINLFCRRYERPVHLHWACRTTSLFESMGPFLQELTSFPHVRVWLYMTGKIDESTNLTIGQYQINKGRPNISEALGLIEEDVVGSFEQLSRKVGVYSCGPEQMMKEVQAQCSHFNKKQEMEKNISPTTFYYEGEEYFF